MVDLTDEKVWQEVIETFAFELGQEIADAAPKDTGAMSRSFLAPPSINGNRITYNPLFYWEFQEFGTKNLDGSERIAPKAFVRTTVFTKSEEIFQRALQGLSNK